MNILPTLLNFIFPTHCLSCRQYGEDLCLKCLASFPQAERQTLEWIYPIYDYRHKAVKEAIWLLKYKNHKRLAGVLAEALYARILEELSELSVMGNFHEPVLIPIPLSKERQRERGFNQALLLCRAIVALDSENNLELNTNVLVKPRDTEHQARIEDRAHRLKNIIGSFAIKNTDTIKNRNIILVDDVTTTGATLSEAKKILKQAGAKNVIAFTVAH